MYISSERLKRAQHHVSNLKKWRFRAEQGKNKSLKELQRISTLIEKSYDTFIVALYEVTHSSGNKTNGIDRIRLKWNDEKSYKRAYNHWKACHRSHNGHLHYQPKPLKRVYIPKPDGSKRPLGIPSHLDRLSQHILNHVVEVHNENFIVKHAIQTFGFRKGFRAQDAISCLTTYAWQGNKAWVLELDIEKCFDKISHEYIMDLLVKKVGVPKRSIEKYRKILESGYFDIDGTLHDTTEGTPQGGIISPALCNLVLRHALDYPLTKATGSPSIALGLKYIQCMSVISYADDMVICLSPQTRIKNPPETMNGNMELLKNYITELLKPVGLKLKESKTRVISDNTPFEFLGVQIRRGLGIIPTPKKVKAHLRKVRLELRSHKHDHDSYKLRNANAIIRGFYNYYSHFSSGRMWKVLGKCDWYNGRWVWKTHGYDMTPNLITYTDIPKTTKYISPKRGSSIFMNPEFFENRMWKPRQRNLAKRQAQTCPVCQNGLGNNPSQLHVHHIIPKGEGGKDLNTNVVIVHEHCHVNIHRSYAEWKTKLIDYMKNTMGIDVVSKIFKKTV